jgi:hypothetical protein
MLEHALLRILEDSLLRMRELLLLRRRIADSTLEEDHSGEAVLDEVEERVVQPAKDKQASTLLNHFKSFKGTICKISWEGK